MGKSQMNLSQTIKLHIALYISVRAVSYQKRYCSIFLTHRYKRACILNRQYVTWQVCSLVGDELKFSCI